MKVFQLTLSINTSSQNIGGEFDLFDLEEEIETEACGKINLELDLDQMEVE